MPDPAADAGPVIVMPVVNGTFVGIGPNGVVRTRVTVTGVVPPEETQQKTPGARLIVPLTFTVTGAGDE